MRKNDQLNYLLMRMLCCLLCSSFLRLFDYCGRERTRTHKEDGTDLARLVVHQRNGGRQQTVATIKALPWPLLSRELVFHMEWNKEEDKSMTLTIVPANGVLVDYGFLHRATIIKASIIGYCGIQKIAEDRCKVTIYQSFNPGMCINKEYRGRRKGEFGTTVTRSNFKTHENSPFFPLSPSPLPFLPLSIISTSHLP